MMVSYRLKCCSIRRLIEWIVAFSHQKSGTAPTHSRGVRHLVRTWFAPGSHLVRVRHLVRSLRRTFVEIGAERGPVSVECVGVWSNPEVITVDLMFHRMQILCARITSGAVGQIEGPSV